MHAGIVGGMAEVYAECFLLQLQICAKSKYIQDIIMRAANTLWVLSHKDYIFGILVYTSYHLVYFGSSVS